MLNKYSRWLLPITSDQASILSRIQKAGGNMDDQKYNDNDLTKIVKKAESLKSLLSDHKTAAPEADASAATQAEADQAAPKATTAPKRPLHMPSASVHQAADKRQSVADLFAKAVDRSQKSQKEWVEETVTARVEKEKAKLMEEQESRAEALRAEAEAKISEATQNREAVEKEMAELKEEAEAKAQSDAEARADLEARLSEKDEQLSAAEAEKQAAEEKAEAEAKAWETARAEAEARAKAQEEALAALQARLEENEARLAALEAERSQLQQVSAAEEVLGDAPAMSEPSSAPAAAEERAPEAAENPLASEAAEEAAQAPDGIESEETASDFWEDDEGLFESEDLPEGTDAAPEALAAETRDEPEAAQAPSHADLVTDHTAFRTHQPQESVALSENIPWVSPNISEKRRERRLEWLEAEDQNQAEPEAPQAAAEPAGAAEPMDRKTEEDRDVLDVLRKLANARPVPGETGIAAAESADASPADGAVEDWLFEEDEILPDAEAELFETETLPETPSEEKPAETLTSEAAADVPAEPEKDDFWQTEPEAASDAVEMTGEAPDFWGGETPEAAEDRASSEDDTLWHDAAPAAEMAEESPATEEAADLPAGSGEVAEGFAIEDTQVLDSEAIDHFFAMSESDDEVPSILDEKTEAARAESAADAAEAKTEAPSADFDDLFEDAETVESAPAASGADRLFESAAAEPKTAGGPIDLAGDKAGGAKDAADDAFNDLFDASEADEELTKAIDRRAIHEKLTPSEQAVYDDLFSDDDADRAAPDEEMAEKPRRRGLFGRKR
jgi:hypothetical protein